MAIKLPIKVTPQIIPEAVEQWIALLVKEDYQAAYEFTEQDEEKEAQIIGNVIYDLPLNGEWSDLSATFYILKKEEFITLELDEIHVF